MANQNKIPRNDQPISDLSGIVTRSWWSFFNNTYVASVTGLNTNNTDPANPILGISVNPSTISGNGTPASPLTVIGGSGSLVNSVNGATGAVILTVANTGTSLAYDVTTKTQLNIPTATTSLTGLLSSTDWNTFSNKQPAGNYITALTGDVTASGPGSVASAIGTNKVTNTQLAQMAAHTFKGNNTSSTGNALDLTATQLTAELNPMVGDSGSGGIKGLVPAPAAGDAAAGKYLKADGTFAVPPGTSIGSVSSVSVATANGFAGTVATATTTPVITLSTSVSGILKGNATAISAATAGTDYSSGTSGLATGILKSTTTTGALTIAAAGDFPTLNQNTSGSAGSLSATLVATSGGTGQSSYAVGDILYASTTTALSRLADVATGNALISGGVTTAPSWGKIGLTTHVSGVLPAVNGGWGSTAQPKYRVTMSGNQSLSSATWTKVQFDTKTYDTNSNYDATTNYRFTPTVSGYYQISFGLVTTAGTVTTSAMAAIYKNGTAYTVTDKNMQNVAGGAIDLHLSDGIPMNGSTDYIEIFVNVTSVGGVIVSSTYGYVSGFFTGS